MKKIILSSLFFILASESVWAQSACNLSLSGSSCSGANVVSGIVPITADSGADIYIDNTVVGNSSYTWNVIAAVGSHQLNICENVTVQTATQDCQQVWNPNENCTDGGYWVDNYVWISDMECDAYDSDGNCTDYVDDGYYEDEPYFEDTGTTCSGGYDTVCNTDYVPTTEYQCGTAITVVATQSASSPPPVSICVAGTYSITANGLSGTLTIPSVSSTGIFSATLTFPGYGSGSAVGNCANGGITFNNGDVFVGSYSSTNSMAGTFTFAGNSSYVWSANFAASAPPPATPPSSICSAGTYSITANGLSGTFTIPSVSSSGGFSATLAFSGYPSSSAPGNCANGFITFNNGDLFVGNYTATNSMNGTFTYAGNSSYVWNANPSSSSPSPSPSPSPAPSSVCASGIYNIIANGLSGTLTIPSVSSNGSFSATIAFSGNPSGSATGSCANGSITFNDGDVFVGSYTSSNSMSGTFSYAGYAGYVWNATLAGSVSPPSSICASGTYNITANGLSGTLTIPSVSSSGSFSATIAFSGNPSGSASGNCANGSITFNDGDLFVGTYTPTNSMAGTFTYGNNSSYVWNATLAGSVSPPSSVCTSGTYNITANGLSGTLTIPSVSSSGDFNATIAFSGNPSGSATGNCANGSITFNDGDVFVGSYTSASSMSGTFSYAGNSSYVWTATLAGPAPAPAAAICAPGTYSITANGLSGTLTIPSVSSNGSFSATIAFSGNPSGSATGNCANGSITFNDGDVFVGSYTSSNSMSGTFSYAGYAGYVWSAALQ